MIFSFLKQNDINSFFILALAFFIGCANEKKGNSNENFMDPTKLKVDFSNYEKLFAPLKDQYLEQEEYYASLPKI